MGQHVLEAGRIGEALRALRVERDVSQSELARRSGIAQPAISRIEAGHEVPSFDRLARIAAGLGLRPVLGFVETSEGADDEAEFEPIVLRSPKPVPPRHAEAWGDLRQRLKRE